MNNNVINFPKRPTPGADAPFNTTSARSLGAKAKGLLVSLARGVGMLFILLWPLLKFVLTIDVVWQFLRMCWYWDTPGMHAGWTFSLHFLLLSAGYFFVASYRPKGFD